eukprot:g4195.t1
MLYLIGLGLGNEKDISVAGLEAVRKCERVYLESYTSILGVNKERLEAFYGRPLLDADRDCVESDEDVILEACATEEEEEKNSSKSKENGANDNNSDSAATTSGPGESFTKGSVALLVVGDPFGATTHSDLLLRARSRGIRVKVFHNASILNAIGACGLQLYQFGRVVSFCFWTDTWNPESYFDKIVTNMRNNFHTLCLLDIKTKEPDWEARARGRRNVMLPPRYMTVRQALRQIKSIIERRQRDYQFWQENGDEAEFQKHPELQPTEEDAIDEQKGQELQERRKVHLEKLKKEYESTEVLNWETAIAIGVARIGHDNQVIRAGKVADLLDACDGKKDSKKKTEEEDLGEEEEEEDEYYDAVFGGPLHSLVVCAPEMHFLERKNLDLFWTSSSS